MKGIACGRNIPSPKLEPSASAYLPAPQHLSALTTVIQQYEEDGWIEEPRKAENIMIAAKFSEDR